MERDPFEGGSDFGLDLARDLGDAPPSAIRDTAPDVLSPIDADVAGQRPRPGTRVDHLGRGFARARLDAARATSSSPPCDRSAPRAWPSSRSIATT